jgi:dienelactone hydrolase
MDPWVLINVAWYYPGAYHAFDNPALDPPREYRFGTLGYNKPASEAAWAELAKFLKR